MGEYFNEKLFKKINKNKYLFWGCITMIIFIIWYLTSKTPIYADDYNYKFIDLCIRGIVCILVVNITYLLIFLKSKEFKYILEVFGNLLEKNKFLKRFILE